MGTPARSAFLLLLAVTAGAAAFDGLKLRLSSHLDSLAGPAWTAEGIDLSLQRSSTGKGMLQIVIEQLILPAPLAPLTGLGLQCRDFVLTAQQVRCTSGALHLARSGGEPAAGEVSFDYRRADGTLDFSIAGLAVAGGQVEVRGKRAAGAWNLALEATGLDAAAATDLVRLPASWSVDRGQTRGRITISASLSGQDAALREARLRLACQDLGFSAAAGHYAAQALAARLEGHWRSGAQSTADLALSAGQLYLQPVFLELSPDQEPATATVAGRLDRKRLVIDRLSLRDAGVLQVQGSALIPLGSGHGPVQADIQITQATFPAVYTRYLQPFLADTALGDLQTAGRFWGRGVVSGGTLQVIELDLMDLVFDDRQGRFGVNSVYGRLAWSRDTAPRRSDLRWVGGHAYRLQIGAGTMALESRGGTFRLLGRGRIPVLDGAVMIDRMEGRGIGSADFSWQFDGLLTPVSMQALSEALDWPPLSGKLSGVIPDVRYADQRLEVGGALLVRIFDGDITITHLRMENPFGTVPKVFADVDVRGLDLRALTGTFDFGKIEGKLDGSIRDLRLEDWKPVSFEAGFATPSGDRSRRRISQRAVENLSALGGGGAAAALSRGFVSMFKEFNYARLGISCRLANGICAMGGVKPAGEGYYLVEGEGLPRIDVIGYTRRVDWEELLARLRAAAQSRGPIVQ